MGVRRISRWFRTSLMVVVALMCGWPVIGAQALTQLPAPSEAPPPPPGANAVLDSARAIRGARVSISLITYGPSGEVWERFGHDAIAVHDSSVGIDVAYNWGIFSFEQPGFYWKFLTGDTRYWMAAFQTEEYNAHYKEENRTIRVQQLALSNVEKAALAEFLVWNAAEENKYYRYDYYNDNCSTRARDALDYVLKGRLKPALDTGTFGRTWRGETARVTGSDLLVYSGIEVALGRNADKKLTPWAESFMPERLADAMQTLVIRNDAGERYKIIAHDSVLFRSTRIPMPLDPPDRVSMAALLGLTIAGIIAFLADSRFRFSRAMLVTFVSLWYIIGGLAGTALLLAGTVTKHAPYMGSNTTLWQMSPVLLFAAFVIPASLSRLQTSTAARIVSSLILALSVIGMLLQFIPSLSQQNGVVVAVTFPVHFALAIALWRMSSADSPRRFPAAAPRAA